MRVLTFDIEEWYHILEYPRTRSEAQWTGFESRLAGNCDRILRILADHKTRATFFCLGWVAERHPDVLRRIAAEGYEIGSHSHHHRLAYELTPAEFAEDLGRSVKCIEDVIQRKVRSFRAPGFSLGRENAWVFDELLARGIDVDCSVFPAVRAHGSFPDFGAAVPSRVRCAAGEVKELPMNTRRLVGRDIVFSGGGYFRLFPYALIHRWTERAPYLMSYFHPRDFDPGQPVLRGLSPIRRFKSYYGLATSEAKLRRLLGAFEFTDLQGAVARIDWSAAPVIDLRDGRGAPHP
jgi:polysaccharide deacetylase family protein (PEP-CTERM system associated)